jgi:hypothetical protein
LSHDGVVYNVGDTIEADKVVLDELGKAGVVERIKAPGGQSSRTSACEGP